MRASNGGCRAAALRFDLLLLPPFRLPLRLLRRLGLGIDVARAGGFRNAARLFIARRLSPSGREARNTRMIGSIIDLRYQYRGPMIGRFGRGDGTASLEEQP